MLSKRFSPSSGEFLPGENLLASILASKIRNLVFLPAVEIFSQEKISEFGLKEIFSQLWRFSPRRKSLNLASKRFSPSSGEFLPGENLLASILASKIRNLDFLPAVEIFVQEKIFEF